MYILLSTLPLLLSSPSYIFGIIAAFVGFIGIIVLFTSSQLLRQIIGAILFAFLPVSVLSMSLLLSTQHPAPAISTEEFSGIVGTYITTLLLSLLVVKRNMGITSREKKYNELLKEQELRKPLPAKVGTIFDHPEDDRHKIIILEGDIRDLLYTPIARVDVIVNSENDYMMLGRPYDRNVSGALRYLDAVKDEGNLISIDALAENLEKRLHYIKDSETPKKQPLPVRIGAVFETETTGLSKQGVKYIFHVATVTTLPGGGFTTDPRQLPACIRSCFDKMKDLYMAGKQIKTILFPLIGAGDGGLTARESAEILVPHIVEMMKLYGGVQTTYLLAYNGLAREALLRAANAQGLETSNSRSA